jgi:hypothetical protein
MLIHTACSAGPTRVDDSKNPGTLLLICFKHPSANRNSDLVAVSDFTALRKSERTMGTDLSNELGGRSSGSGWYLHCRRLVRRSLRWNKGQCYVRICVQHFLKSCGSHTEYDPRESPNQRSRPEFNRSSHRVAGITDSTEHQRSISKRPDLVRDASSLPDRLEGIPRCLMSCLHCGRRRGAGGGTKAIAYVRIHLRSAFPEILWLTD